MQPGDEVERIGALRQCVLIMRRGGVPSSLIERLVQFHRGRPRRWVALPGDKAEKAFAGLLNGERLVAWLPTIEPPSGVEELDSGQDGFSFYFLSGNRDLAEFMRNTVAGSDVSGSVVNGLAFGYPVDRVFGWVLKKVR